jgi:hypothetical protein
MKIEKDALRKTLHEAFDVLAGTLESHRIELKAQEVGSISFVGPGVLRVAGLRGVRSQELLRFLHDDRLGMAFDVGPNETGVVLLDERENLEAVTRFSAQTGCLSSRGRCLGGPGDRRPGASLDNLGIVRSSGASSRGAACLIP